MTDNPLQKLIDPTIAPKLKLSTIYKQEIKGFPSGICSEPAEPERVEKAKPPLLLHIDRKLPPTTLVARSTYIAYPVTQCCWPK